MKSTRAVVARTLCAVFAALALLAPVASAQDPRTSAAANAARDWLAVVDRGDTAAAYKAAGAKFRGTMAGEGWSRALISQRAPRGKLVQRTLVQTTFTKQLPGAPEGDYAMLLFRTVFEKEADAGETVTLEREKDGAWRVVGYFIR